MEWIAMRGFKTHARFNGELYINNRIIKAKGLLREAESCQDPRKQADLYNQVLDMRCLEMEERDEIAARLEA